MEHRYVNEEVCINSHSLLVHSYTVSFPSKYFYYLHILKGQSLEEIDEHEEMETAAASTRRKRQGPLIEDALIGE